MTRKVNLKTLFAAKGGIIKSIEGYPHKVVGDNLYVNMRRDQAEDGWVPCVANDWAWKSGGGQTLVYQALMPVREFELWFGWTPKLEFIVEAA